MHEATTLGMQSTGSSDEQMAYLSDEQMAYLHQQGFLNEKEVVESSDGMAMNGVPAQVPASAVKLESVSKTEEESSRAQSSKIKLPNRAHRDEVIELIMDSTNEMAINLPAVNPQETTGNVSQVESLNQHVDEIFVKVDKFEQKLNGVEQFYSGSNTKQLNTPKGSSIWKEKDREKLLASFKRRQQQGAVRREATAAKRMQELMHQFATILRSITEHSWAEPFMHPVDVVGLGLHDYYEVIKKPMDFSTIKSKMEAKDGTEYKHVREICADVRLVFKNAMKYNDEKMDVHIMAKSLLDKFETKWLQLLPKVDEEEKRRKEEEAEMQFDIRLAHEAAHAKAAKELSSNLEEVEKQLRELRETVLQNCRKMSTEEKKKLGSAITRLSPEDINKALEIVAQNDPNFQLSEETVEVDIDTQSESTLWKLKFFVKDALEKHMKNSIAAAKEVVTNNNQRENSNNNQNKRREISDVMAKTSNRRTKRHPK